MRVPARRHTAGIRPERRLRAGLVLAGLILLLLVVAFGRQTFERGGTDVRAVFASANQLKSGSVVRVAGLDVGRVTAIAPAGDDGRALVTMHLKSSAPTLHADTTMDIEPRLAFEGNFYVKVDTGSSDKPKLATGDTIPQRQTTVPVQVDQVLDVFDADVRGATQDSLREASRGLGSAGSPSARRTRKTGSDGLRRGVRELNGALGSITRVSRAARGTQPGDLGRAIDGTRRFTDELARDPATLSRLVSTYRTTFAALSADDRALAGTVTGFDRVLRTAPAELTRLDAVLPRLDRFSDALRPVLKDLPRTQASFTATLDQLAGLSGRGELGTLVDKLDGPVASLPALTDGLDFALPLVTPIGRCLSHQIIPMLNATVDDGKLSTGQKTWEELVHAFAGLAGGSSDFDANGTTFRAGLATGENTFQTVVPGAGKFTSFLSNGTTGVNPAWLGYGKRPPKVPTATCADQPRSDLRSTPAARVPDGVQITPAPKTTGTSADKAASLTTVLKDLRKSLQGPDGKEAGR